MQNSKFEDFTLTFEFDHFEALIPNIMRRLLLIVALLLTTMSFGQDTRNTTTPCLTVEGTISKTSIYIQNPEAGDGNGFCMDSVFVNSIQFADSLFNQSAFEIDFTKLGLKTGDAVVIKLHHKPDCKPILLASGCLPTNNGVQFLEIKVNQLKLEN